ncbi:uncharacterized protein [Watersipora subatra]|uniref:uncharacterized protein n=1 Tax=Watersipora subatra TaxID=2589382 RepID=UPI00355B557D
MADVQIDHESALESFDGRRVNQLKAQVVQLERQAVLMTQTLSRYKQKLHAADGAIHHILNSLQANLETCTKKGNITLNRSDISSQIRVLEDALQRLTASSIRTDDPSWIAQAYTPHTTFLKKDSQPDAGLASISTNPLKHLSLVHVTNLEQRLCKLYGELCAYALKHEQTRSSAKLCESLQKSCEDLQELSFLVPSVPWANRKCLPEVTVDDFMKALPKLTANRQQEVKDLVSAVLKLSEHRYRLLDNKSQAFELELRHLKESDRKSSAHVRSSSESLITELQTYHESIQETLVAPLGKVLANFNLLSTTPTDDNLKLVLQELKDNAPQLQHVCDAIGGHNFSDDCLKVSHSTYQKSLRKILKELKFEKMKLEDTENELYQAEREAQNEVKKMISKISKNPKNVKMKPLDISQSKPLDISQSKSNKQIPMTSTNPSAATFLAKYETLENSLLAAKAEENTSALASKTRDKQPSWLQEMKDDLSAKTDNGNSATLRSVSFGGRRLKK